MSRSKRRVSFNETFSLLWELTYYERKLPPILARATSTDVSLQVHLNHRGIPPPHPPPPPPLSATATATATTTATTTTTTTFYSFSFA